MNITLSKEAIIALFAIIWTIYQEVRHIKNHGTISPQADKVKDIVEHQIEQELLDYLKNKDLLKDHKIEIKINKK